MDRVRARESPHSTNVSQITLQYLVGEWLRMPFGLAENSGATLFVQTHDVKLMVGIPGGVQQRQPVARHTGATTARRWH